MNLCCQFNIELIFKVNVFFFLYLPVQIIFQIPYFLEIKALKTSESQPEGGASHSMWSLFLMDSVYSFHPDLKRLGI
jgi:hypothetical protein